MRQVKITYGVLFMLFRVKQTFFKLLVEFIATEELAL